MLDMSLFGEELNRQGFNFYSGVPCSFLKSMINYAINEQEFIMSANEGDAVAVCAGAQLGGKKAVFLCQNSGLTNAVSPLTSLNQIFKIPVLGFVSLRGEEGLQDEPQHELMGRITKDMLVTMEIANDVLSDDLNIAKRQLIKANEYIERGESFFFIVKKNTLGPVKLQEQPTRVSPAKAKLVTSQAEKLFPKRIEALQVVQDISDAQTVLLATTGVTGRELYELADKANQLYMVGSMGCVSSLGLGLALARPDINVIVIDGDGAFLMRMGAITTNAYYAPANLYHLLLDNGVHESTGGQATVSSRVDFPQIVSGSGYNRVETLHSLEELQDSLSHWQKNKGLTFSYLAIQQGVKENLGRPKVTPEYVKDRFINFLGGVEHDK